MAAGDSALIEPQPAIRRLGRSGALALLPALALLGLLFGGALAGALKVSLLPLGGALGDAGFEVWRGMFADPAFVDALLFTLKLALISTVLAAGAGLLLALALRGAGTGTRLLGGIAVPIPHLIIAAGAVLWLAPGGLADRLLGAVPVDLVRDSGGVGVIAVYVYKEAPFIALLLLATMGASLRGREEAAMVLGASPLQRLRWVIWPAVRRPLLLGSAIVAAFTIGAFEVPLTVGPNYPPTLATYAFEATQGDVISGEGTAAAALLVAGLLAIALAAAAVQLARSVEDE